MPGSLTRPASILALQRGAGNTAVWYLRETAPERSHRPRPPAGGRERTHSDANSAGPNCPARHNIFWVLHVGGDHERMLEEPAREQTGQRAEGGLPATGAALDLIKDIEQSSVNDADASAPRTT